MIKRYPIYDGGLGSLSNGVPVYDPFSPNNNPSWTSPEYGGGSGGGMVQPFWITQPNDPDPIFGPPQQAENAPPVPSAPVPPIKVLPPSAQTDGDSGFDTNTVLIGGVVIIAAILLLRK